jgi:hypothetical protein
LGWVHVIDQFWVELVHWKQFDRVLQSDGIILVPPPGRGKQNWRLRVFLMRLSLA